MRAQFAPPGDATMMSAGRIRILPVLALVGVLVAAGLAYLEYEALQHARSQLVAFELQPIATLLTENQSLFKELQSAPFSENDSGILESYLAKIRRDGVSRHADMKQRLDTLAENNTAIVTLVKAYTPQSKTSDFRIEADKFRNYASVWRERWNSVMELFMGGGNYAASTVPPPLGFSQAVNTEIAAVK